MPRSLRGIAMGWEGSMTDAYRTPDERFEGLPEFDLPARYREVGGLRLAHVEDGEGAPVVFLHGEPTWSFLWRKVIPPVRDAGFRCVAPDLVGFGRSDKPISESWYSFDRHTEVIASLLDDLDLRDVTLVLHDWGGPIGLRIAVEQPDRVARLVAMDTGIFTGPPPMSEAWQRFADFVARTEDLPIGFLVRQGCARDPGDEVTAAYEAPFPEPAAKAGAKAFPALIPRRPDAPGAAAGGRTFAGLVGDRRPLLLLWGEEDRPLPVAAGEALAEAPGLVPRHALDPGDVAARGRTDRLGRVPEHVPVPPAAIDAVEGQRLQGLRDPIDLRGGQRDEVRVAAHEGDVAAIAHHRDRVPDQERATPGGAAGPVEHRRPREVPAALDQRDAGHDLQAVLPEPHRRVGAHDPGLVRARQVHGGVEGVAPLHQAAVEVRVGRGDAGQPAELAHPLHGGVVEVARAVPEHVAGLGLDQEGALADRQRRGHADAGETGLQLAKLRAEALGGQFLQGGPLLALPADVLALVLADRAA